MNRCNYCKLVVGINDIFIITPTTNKKRVFCTNECLNKYCTRYNVGRIHSLKTKLKIAKSNSKPFTQERKVAISKAKTFKFTQEQILLIDSYLTKPYIYQLNLFKNN